MFQLSMKPNSLLIRLFVSVLLTACFACNRPLDPPSACRLTSTTDQLMEASGRLTDEMQRTFTYTNAVLTSVAERSTNQEAGFLVERIDQRVVRAAISGTMAIGLEYLPAATQPNSATFSRGGKVASTFAMEYNPAGRMSRVVESRIVRPANSLTAERAFTFTYDNTGNLVNERVRFTSVGGTVTEQETEYTVAANPSPYALFAERALLTVVALSQAVDTQPGRFWHLNAPAGYKSYNLTGNGSRGNLRESTTFVTTYDGDSKLMSQEQNALLYQLSVPDPITKRNRQAFAYQCD